MKPTRQEMVWLKRLQRIVGDQPEWTLTIGMEVTGKTMKLVRISHSRCGEKEAETLLWAKDYVTPEQLEKDAEVAAKRLLDAEKVLKQKYDSPGYYGLPDRKFLEARVDKSVGEALVEWNKLVKEAEDLRSKRLSASRSFANFMLDTHHYEMFFEHEADLEYEIYWGHLHDVGIDYGEEKLKDLKPREEK